MPVSKDRLLRTVRARTPAARPTSRVIVSDDWAWKRGHRYGSIACDLKQCEIVDVHPDREAATVEAWLAVHPEVEIVSQDRGGGYGQAVASAAPEVVQGADHWHLMAYASQAFLTWFVNEQVEEEANASELIDRLTMAGDDKAALLMLDHELKSRE